MIRSEAYKLLIQEVNNQNLVKHSLAAEAIMGALAARLGEDGDQWRLAGLLHDIDYDATKDDPAQHSRRGSEMLSNFGLEKGIVRAVLVHNDYHGLSRETLLEKALHAVDPLTGLVTAAALIRKEKTLSTVTPEFVLSRFREKGFARGANREQIARCGEFGLSLEEFVALGLAAMQNISDELGL